MQNVRLRIMALVGVSWLTPLLAAHPPANLGDAKQAVRIYHDSGEYGRDLAEVAEEAKAWVIERAATRDTDQRLAMVFDVDETVLSNYPHMEEQDFGYVPEVWTAWVEEAAAPVLESIKAVYLTAREHGVAVIFLTGRLAPEEEAGTIENLAAVGMGDYERIIFRSAEDTASTAAERKRLRRAALEEEGWTIIASIGDQDSDLAGGHAEKMFKLPNPFYKVP
jgi:acid phosphatase